MLKRYWCSTSSIFVCAVALVAIGKRDPSLSFEKILLFLKHLTIKDCRAMKHNQDQIKLNYNQNKRGRA